MDFEKINAIAEEHMLNKKSYDFAENGNKYYHGQRVAKLSLTLRSILIPNDESNDNILTVASWFHDIANGRKNHTEPGAEMTRELLHGLCTSEELDKICSIIAVHDDRYNGNVYPELTKIVQDADLLDHFGSYDVFINFSYVVVNNLSLQKQADKISNTITTDYNKFKSGLNYNISRMIFDNKVAFVAEFNRRFKSEYNGDVFGFSEILSKYTGES